MIDNSLHEKTIQHSNSQPLFKYDIWFKILIAAILPLGILAILVNQIYIRSYKKHEHDESRRKLLEIKIMFLGICLTVFILDIILVVTIHNWSRWLLFWLFSGLTISMFALTLFSNRLNIYIHKQKIAEAKIIEHELEEQRIHKTKPHPYIEFWTACCSYKLWGKIEHEYFLKQSKITNPISWKNGIIVNREKGVMVPIEVWNMHFLFAGSSGFGKTYNIIKLCFAAAYNKFHICVLDGKADPKLETELRRIAALFNLPITVWNLKDPRKAKYNPFSQKSRIELIDMISEIFDYSLKKRRADTNIYAAATRQWITLIVDFLLMFNQLGGVTLENLAKFTNIGIITKYLKKAGSEEETEKNNNDLEALSDVNTNEQKPVNKKVNEIKYKNTPAGFLFRKLNELMATDPKQLQIIHNDFDELFINTKNVIGADGISIKDFMRSGSPSIILFQFANNITNQAIEKILLYDFTCLVDFNQEQREFDNKLTLLVIDEAASIFQDQGQVTDMVQQFRSKLISLAFGFQERAGLEKEGKQGLLESLVNNSTTFFISRLRDDSTIQTISAIYGTKKHMMPTEQTTVGAKGEIIHSGTGSVRIDETFVWHPNDIRKLLKGQVMFSTLSKKVQEIYPHYPIIESDEIISSLQVDNVVETINDFEARKAKSGKTFKIENKTIPIQTNQNLTLIQKIEAMSPQAYDVYRRQRWNAKCQRENKIVSENPMPDDFISNKTAYITWLQQHSE